MHLHVYALIYVYDSTDGALAIMINAVLLARPNFQLFNKAFLVFITFNLFSHKMINTAVY